MIIRLAPQWCRPRIRAPPVSLHDDVAKAFVRVAGGRRVVERQQNSGDHLDQKREQRDAAQHLVPSRGIGDVFIQKMLDRRFDAGAIFQPFEDALAAWWSTPISLRPTRSGSCCRRGA